MEKSREKTLQEPEETNMPKKTTKAKASSPSRISHQDMEDLVHARHWDPFSMLGPHSFQRDGRTWLAIRAFVPGVQSVTVLPSGGAPCPGPPINDSLEAVSWTR